MMSYTLASPPCSLDEKIIKFARFGQSLTEVSTGNFDGNKFVHDLLSTHNILSAIENQKHFLMEAMER